MKKLNLCSPFRAGFIFGLILVFGGGDLTASSKVKVDSFEKVIVVPFHVMFSHSPSPEKIEKMGVVVEVASEERERLLTLYNESDFQSVSNASMDGRLVIIGVKNKSKILIMMDRPLDRVSVGGRIFKLKRHAFSDAIKNILELQKDAIEAAFQKKAYPTPKEE
ncbi:hypothetical protein [Geothrix limicola]|uniref:hypothetical protein n=1 Tax=Geothrix limicola TaxID=2927978 RepID=UPI002555100E|nr:hypothetical protein [Geothrix limicola]